MKDYELKAFHRRMLLGEFRPADDEAAQALNLFMQHYSIYQSFQLQQKENKAAEALFKARRVAKEVKRLIESNRIAEGAQ